MTHLIGDIGNTESKLCILNNNYKIIRRLRIDSSKLQDHFYFKKKIFPFIHNKVENRIALFSSVMPSVFFNIKKKTQKIF